MKRGYQLFRDHQITTNLSKLKKSHLSIEGMKIFHNFVFLAAMKTGIKEKQTGPLHHTFPVLF